MGRMARVSIGDGCGRASGMHLRWLRAMSQVAFDHPGPVQGVSVRPAMNGLATAHSEEAICTGQQVPSPLFLRLALIQLVGSINERARRNTQRDAKGEHGRERGLADAPLQHAHEGSINPAFQSQRFLTQLGVFARQTQGLTERLRHICLELIHPQRVDL